MKIEYENTKDDFWNYHKYLMLKHPIFRRNMLTNLLSIPIMIALIGYIMGDSPSIIIFTTIIGGLLGIPFILYLSKRQINKLPLDKEGGLLGKHTIEFVDNGFKETTSVNDSFHLWHGIHKVDADKNNIYIFIDTHMAFVIPKRFFSSEKKAKDFLEEATTLWKTSTI